MEDTKEERPSLVRRAGGVVILIAVAYLLFKVVFHVIVGVVASVAWALVAIVAVFALFWALRQF